MANLERQEWRPGGLIGGAINYTTSFASPSNSYSLASLTN